jgi:hypothetical protein
MMVYERHSTEVPRRSPEMEGVTSSTPRPPAEGSAARGALELEKTNNVLFDPTDQAVIPSTHCLLHHDILPPYIILSRRAGFPFWRLSQRSLR